MTQIEFAGVSKSFNVSQREPGLSGALKGLLVRRTRTIAALTDVSFSIAAGECVAFLGPNGAGKSTTVKILSGILAPDAGTISVQGRHPSRDRLEHVREIGVVFGQRSQLWWDLPVRESFQILGRLYGLSTNETHSRADDLFSQFDLGSFQGTPVRQLSLGQRMRAEVAAALLHRPRILLLDEPTIGLDAVSMLALRRMLRTLNRETGVTIILTTHNMDDVKELCDRALLIARGQVVFDGTLAQVRKLTDETRVMRLILTEARPLLDVMKVAPAGLRLRRQDVAESDVFEFEFAIDPDRIPQVLTHFWQVLPIADVAIEHAHLDVVLAKLYAHWSTHADA